MPGLEEKGINGYRSSGKENSVLSAVGSVFLSKMYVKFFIIAAGENFL